jgi:flagellar biosynthesis regulator FlbT
MTRQIGGVQYNRAHHGQPSDRSPLVPVSEEKQKKAMQALTKYAFAPDAFKHFSDLYQYLLAQRRGFGFFGNNPDPKIHERILNMQKECLNQLLHPNVLQRITDSQLYGNTYTLDEVMTDLTNSLFQADVKISVNTVRQNVQVNYVERLAKMISADSRYDNISKGMALYELKRIDQMMTTGTSPDGLTKAHREYVKTIIKQALEA